MSTEQTNQLPLEQTAPQTEQPKAEAQTTTVAKVTKSRAVDKSLVTASIKKLPQQLAPLAGCFDNAWDGFVKAYGDGAGQVMAKEIDFAAQAMLSNPYLIRVATDNPVSLINALKNLALVGYTLNPVRKQGYLVPMGKAITFIPSYMGLVDELVASGLVKKIEAHPVFDGEDFEIKLGTNGYLRHKPNPWGKREKENLKGCYWYAVLVDGTEMFDTISLDEIEKIRKRAPSAKSSSPWDTDYIEMARKTAVRNGYKKVPKKGISEDKLKVLDVMFDYDEKVEQNWIAEQKQTAASSSRFDEDEVEYEEINE